MKLQNFKLDKSTNVALCLWVELYLYKVNTSSVCNIVCGVTVCCVSTIYIVLCIRNFCNVCEVNL